MANEKNNLDQFFKEKLENHTEKPSSIAWERLESQLPKKARSYKGIWWAAAASLTILFTIGYLVLREGEMVVEKPLLSENKTEKTTETPTHIETIQPQPQEIRDKQAETENQQPTEELKTKPTTTPQPSAKPADSSSKTQKSQSISPQNLIALTAPEAEQEKAKVEETPNIRLETPEIPQIQPGTLELEKTVAEVNEPVETEPAYRVKIYSSGLTQEPKDKNLLAEIGKTVNEVEGLLGKVDQGFANLQDAKNNLFASITSKKSRGED